MREYAYLPNADVRAICKLFNDTVPNIFGRECIFAFLFGGIAKGYATSAHDIDMFICVETRSGEALVRFREWYEEMHLRFGLCPDRVDPGEILGLDRLRELIVEAESTAITPVVRTYREYETIVLTDIVGGVKTAVIGNESALSALEARAEAVVKRWKREARALLGRRDRDEYARLDLRKLLQLSVTYMKEEPPSRLAENPPAPRWAKRE